jgi:hypothetical protein
VANKVIRDWSTGVTKTFQDNGDGSHSEIIIARPPVADPVVIPSYQAVVITTNGSGADTDVSKYVELDLFINITAVSGTAPTVVFNLDTKSEDAAPAYGSIFTSSAQTGTGLIVSSVGPGTANAKGFGRTVRFRWASVGGTGPSFTVSFTLVGKYA